jgi:malonyl-CoA/methylmalonyl-CoA synthetase
MYLYICARRLINWGYLVTLLSILGTHSIALPLSPAFPPHELQYIMDHSQAKMLLSSEKFAEKAKQLFEEGLERAPKYVRLEKKMGNNAARESVALVGSQDTEGGMMLYTSGTTNRPVIPTANIYQDN